MSPLPAVTVFIDGDDVRVHDHNGWATIPADLIPELHRAANWSDAEHAMHRGRRYHRDLLASALDLLNARETCTNCGDWPGVHPMGDGKKFCTGCCSGAAGSRYDDKEDLT